ncbi:MAG: response regulator [Selenomonadaceae bacterium]|nr:response regulator [Selenomonadaceae bacterium]
MKKILLVDNMEVGREFIETVLSTMYETFGASTGEEALKIFREARPDLVLSKVRLPDMSGAELLNKLQSEFGEIIPFVMTGIDNASETESEALKSGAWDFIRIPFAPEILFCRLEKVLWFAERLTASCE